MTLEDSIPWPDHPGGHAFRLRVMVRAQQLGNVSQACWEFGISRSPFYRWRKRYLAYDPHGLHPGRRAVRRGRPPSLNVQAERSILAPALAWPT